jgi:hypothetical protein
MFGNIHVLLFSARAFGAMMTSIVSPAWVGSVGPDLGFDLADELLYRFFAIENALSLIDFVESLSGSLPERFQPKSSLLFPLLSFQKAQSLTDDLAGVAVTP